MKKIFLQVIAVVIAASCFAQKIETVYLDPADSSANMYIAVSPNAQPIKAFMFLLDGFGASPKQVLAETKLPAYAAGKGILTIIPVLKTGPLYFGVDSISQQSLADQIKKVVEKYHLQQKDFYIGGFSIGGSSVVQYARLAAIHPGLIKPKAVFAVDPRWTGSAFIMPQNAWFEFRIRQK